MVKNLNLSLRDLRSKSWQSTNNNTRDKWIASIFYRKSRNDGQKRIRFAQIAESSANFAESNALFAFFAQIAESNFISCHSERSTKCKAKNLKNNKRDSSVASLTQNDNKNAIKFQKD